MNRLLLDANIVLDFVLARPPHADAATALWAVAERKEVEAFVPAHGVTTIFYLAARFRNAAFARQVVNDLVLVPAIAAVDGAILRRAFGLGWPDLENAVCAAAAEAAGCDLLVTRDPRGFPASPVAVVDPPTALAILSGHRGPEGVAEGQASARRRSGRSGGHRRSRSPVPSVFPHPDLTGTGAAMRR